MAFKCKIGLHSWEGCKCSGCGKIRDKQHARNSCKCDKCGKVFDFKHDWSNDCEKCSKCGKKREAAHAWSNNCERCSICGKTRDNQHYWKGCKCSICGKFRDEQHDWNSCKCSICGKTRDERHSWKDCKCSMCGKTRDEQHNWKDCKCSICGKPTDQHHAWNGCKCLICGNIRNEGHIFNNKYECITCATISPIWSDEKGKFFKLLKPKRKLSGNDSSCILYFRNSLKRDTAYRIMTNLFSSCFYHIERRTVYGRSVMYKDWIVCDSNAYNTEIQRYIDNANCECPESQYVYYRQVLQDSDSLD